MVTSLVFGEGNMDVYVRHLPTGAYHVRDRVPDNLIEARPSFDQLLAAALRAHRYLTSGVSCERGARCMLAGLPCGDA